MLDLRIKPQNAFPGRAPRLNRAHPLFSQGHTVFAGVARGKGIFDLVSGTFNGGVNTLGGSDENGPFVYTLSTDTGGSGQCSFSPTGATNFSFISWGVIFKLPAGGGRGWPIALNTNTGLWLVGQSLAYELSNGNYWTPVGIAGHTYFAFANNAVGSAVLQKTAVLFDMTTGQVQTNRSASAGNINASPISINGPAGTFQGPQRTYCAFATASALVPPAVQPAPCFYSIDQIMAGVKDPWGLWYG